MAQSELQRIAQQENQSLRDLACAKGILQRTVYLHGYTIGVDRFSSAILEIEDAITSIKSKQAERMASRKLAKKKPTKKPASGNYIKGFKGTDLL